MKTIKKSLILLNLDHFSVEFSCFQTQNVSTFFQMNSNHVQSFSLNVSFNAGIPSCKLFYQ